jgi:type IV secretion system protein VirD4
MLDEFPTLGKLDILQESLAFLPGYGIKAYLIAQDINQLYAHYGRDEAITSTCHVSARLRPTASKPLNTFQSSPGKPPW